jgi:hypothetical protein
MSDIPPPPPMEPSPSVPTPRPAPAVRPGLITYAGLILGIAGVLSLIVGLVGLTGDRLDIDLPFLDHPSMARVAAVALVVQGGLSLLAGWLVLRLRPAGRILGIVLASVAIVVSLSQLGNTETAGLLAVVLDAFVLYALLTYGYVFKQQPPAR